MRGVSKTSSARRIAGGALSAASNIRADLADVREQVRRNSVRPPRATRAPSKSSAVSTFGAFVFWAAATPYLLLAAAIAVFLLFVLAEAMGVPIDKGTGGPLDTLAWTALLLGAACVYGFKFLVVPAILGLVLWISGKAASHENGRDTKRSDDGERSV